MYNVSCTLRTLAEAVPFFDQKVVPEGNDSNSPIGIRKVVELSGKHDLLFVTTIRFQVTYTFLSYLRANIQEQLLTDKKVLLC